MLLLKKLNFKKFIPISLIPLAICFAFARNMNEVYGIAVVHIATLINIAFLAEGILQLIESHAGRLEKKPEKGKLILLFVGKFIILILGVLFGVQMMGNRIIIPVLNYVIQIFTLSISLRSGDKIQ